MPTLGRLKKKKKYIFHWGFDPFQYEGILLLNYRPNSYCCY